MGVHGMMLLIVVLFSFLSSALFAQVNKNSAPAQVTSMDALDNSSGVVFYPDDTHENMGNNGVSENNCTVGNGCGMVNQSKYTNDITSGRGGGGGRPVGSGGNENGGQTNSSPQGGGNGVVPVYAAGSAAQRRNHKGAAATETPYWKGRLAVLIATATASFLLS